MDYDTLFQRALQYFDAGNLVAAEDIARQIIRAVPDQPDVLNLLGLIAQNKGLHQQAGPYFAAAIRQQPENAVFYFNLAFSLRAAGKDTEALYNFNKVLQLAPHIKETYNEIAFIFENRHQLDEARRYWQTALQMDNRYIIAAVNLANSYRLDNPSKAEEDLRRLSLDWPEISLIWYDLAWLAYNRKDFQEALHCLEKAASLHPKSDVVHYLFGLIFQESGQKKAAVENFEQAITLNPDNINALLHLADIYSLDNNYRPAEKLYKRILELAPDNFAACNNYAEMLYRQKRLPEALETYRRAVIINAQSAEVCNNLGVILKDLKEYTEAAALFINALKLNSHQTETAVNLAETITLLAQTDDSAALRIAQNWHNLFPNDPFAIHTLAALKGETVADTQVFIEKLFDNFADNYELVMQNLDYQAPLAVQRIAGSLVGRIADLGCGSGLIGQAVKTDQNYLIGVDISSKMLQQAKAKQVYDELIKEDILTFLHRRFDFDWVLAIDVAGYLGALDEFVASCRGKNLIFSIETLAGDQVCQRQKNGRFKHNPQAVQNLLRQNNFTNITIENLSLRNENEHPVAGCIIKAQP